MVPPILSAQKMKTAGLALLLGVVSGLACVGVRLGFRLLQWLLTHHGGLLPNVAASLSPTYRIGVPVAGGLLATAVLWAAKRWSRSEPFHEYVEAVRCEDGRIPFASTFWRTLSSAFSVATGAAVGREGSMIQFATAATSWTALRSGLRVPSGSRAVAYGAAAAVAAAYQAPLAGVFFVYEIVLGEWAWAELPALLIASCAGWLISRTLLGAGPLFAIQERLPFAALQWALPLALVLGVVGPGYQKMLESARILRKLPIPLVWAGVAVGLLSLSQPTVWGNGDVALTTTLKAGFSLSALAGVLLFRLLATTACVGTGTVGGVFTPTLFAGAALGAAAAGLTHSTQPVVLAMIGMGAFLAAVTHAPWMAGFMAIELTGQWHLLPLLLVLNLLASWTAKRISTRSLYGIATPTPDAAGLANKSEHNHS